MPVRCSCPFVEEGWFDRPATELVAEEYLAPLRQAGIDTLVLGCTHYPLLKPLLQRVMGPGVDADRQRAGDRERAGARCWSARTWRRRDGRPPTHRFVVSDDEARVRQVGARFIGERLDVGGSGADGVKRRSSGAPRRDHCVAEPVEPGTRIDVVAARRRLDQRGAVRVSHHHETE